MDQTYSSMMSGVPTALAIWLALIGVSAVAFALLAAIAGRDRRRAGAGEGAAAGSVAAGYVPRNAATLRALAAAKAATDDEKPAARTKRIRRPAQPPQPPPLQPAQSVEAPLQPAQSVPAQAKPGRPKAGRSKPNRPRFKRPKAARTEASRPEAARTEASRPEAARPDTGRPERKVPAPREPEATVTEVIEPAEVAEAAPVSDEQRFAEELATAAARAGVTADKRQAEWETARRAVDSAWQAYEQAENAAKRAIRAAAFPIPETPLTPAEFADRERYLHRAARAAHARGELTTDQLIDALSHRNGFDPRLHPFEQDALLRRLGRDRRLRAYQAAAERERTAWHGADQAQAARRSLDREAAAAARNVAPGPERARASRHIRVTTPVLSLR